MITVSVNNEIQNIAEDLRLSELLKQRTSGEKIAVAINGEFVPRSSYDDTVIKADDTIDIVSPVGGG